MPATVTARRVRLRASLALQASAAADALAIARLRVYAPPGRLFVRAETRSGLVGWGECAAAGAEEIQRLRQALLNQPASAYVAIESALPSAVAPAAVAAMLDCLGQHAKAPVYQVLGGPTRFKVRVMAPVANAAEARAARAAGHRAFSLAIPAPPFPNSGKPYVNRIRALFDEVRAAAGEGCDFVLDAQGRLSAGDAAQLAAEFERAHLLWIDEPCRHGNLAALRKIGEEGVTPIGLGRHCRDAAEFQDILREEAADLLRPSLDHFSLARIRKIAALAEIYYIAVAPSHAGGMLATAAALHAAASMPNFFLTQLPARAPDDPVRGLDLTVRDGYVALPTAAGLGITVDEAALAGFEVRA